jgi:hypothetical protein
LLSRDAALLSRDAALLSRHPLALTGCVAQTAT